MTAPNTNDAAKALKDTVLTPKTDFPMKAGLTEREPETLKRWEEKGLYRAIRERAVARNAKRREAGLEEKLFVLHDGPPYANGDAHTGTGMNKILKDFVVKFRTLQGFDAPYIPGWDCHGLPIEHKVLEELGGQKPADMTALEVRAKCKAFAEKFIDTQRAQFKRTLTLGRWEKPYLTINPTYEGGVLDCFADLMERGLITRAKKPVHWSWAAQSALAEAELEYEDRKDPSIYVKFKVEAGSPVVSRMLEATGAKYPMLLIWTTTPWTLPANLAVAVSAAAEYGVYQVGEEAWILAVELAPKVLELAGMKPREPKLRLSGDELTALTYQHPLWETSGHRVLPADYVTLTDGTGLVHTAPGHGADDFVTGKKYGLPAVCPVDERGCYYKDDAFVDQLELTGKPLSDKAKEWLALLSGQHILKANKLIIEKLETEKQPSGQALMVHWFEFTHSYPHCWRTHKPVIFRATEQWFVSIDGEVVGGWMPSSTFGKQGEQVSEGTHPPKTTLREAIMREVGKTKWFPAWGEKRIGGMVSNRPDWCISRQRYWGIPIPAFVDKETGKVCSSTTVARRIADVVREHGSDVWYDQPNWPCQKLLPDEFRPEEFRGRSLARMNDIFDVWFESGASHRGVVAAEAELQGWGVDALIHRTGGWVPSPTNSGKVNDGGWVPSPTNSGKDIHLGYYKPRHLPHFDAPNQAQFITFQLKDSAHSRGGVSTSLSVDRDLGPADPLETHDLLLDAHAGECLLRQADLAQLVVDAIRHFDGVQYDLLAWCVMPNHVHCLAVVRQGFTLSEIVKGWKSVSARKINAQLGRSGTVWQDDYFDRYMRDVDQLSNTVRYIVNNPVKAGLVSRPEDWEFTFAKNWIGDSGKVGEGTHPPMQELVGEGTHPPFRPADLYLEGDDQHRGWFQVSLILSTATQGVSPFKQCLTSAFVVDEKGQKGSKSKGNIFAIDWGCNQVGADLLRLYFATVDTSSPIPVTLDLVRDKTSGPYRTLRNTIRVLLGNLDGFDPATQSVEYERMLEIDRWALSRLAACVEDVTAAWEKYEFHVGTRRLVDFCNLELSAFYIDVTKDRMYCHGRDSHVRRSGLTAMREIASSLIRLLAPVCPHTADEAWSHLAGVDQTSEWSVFLSEAGWPVSGQGLLRPDGELELKMDAILGMRADFEQAFDQLRKAKTLTNNAAARLVLVPNSLARLKALFKGDLNLNDLANYLSVSEVHIGTNTRTGMEGMSPDFGPVFGSQNLDPELWPNGCFVGFKHADVTIGIDKSPHDKCDRCWNHWPSVAPRATVGGAKLCDRCHGVVSK